ncbi:MAG: efflux RND transporter periplasmic adaptor subunit [Verrucomicrobiales bacterium]
MSLDQLLGSPNTPAPTQNSAPAPRRRALPSWLLPAGRLLGFILGFTLLFGKKLLPATPVTTAPVVTLRAETKTTAAPENSPVASSPPARRDLLFQASGWLEPDPYAIQVPALVNGVIDQVHVLEGQQVKKDQLLATLIKDEAALTLEKAERQLDTIRARIAAHCAIVPEKNAALEAAKSKVLAEQATLAEFREESRRLDALPSGAVSQQALTTARQRLARQEALVAEAQNEVTRIEAEIETVDYQRVMMGETFREAEVAQKMAQLALSRHEIRSPIDGIVLRLHAAPGKKRMLGMDDPHSATIVTLYQPEKLQARIDVPLNEAAALQTGQPVELITELLPDTTFHGHVTRITGEADLQRNTLQAKVALQNPDHRLRPEMLMRAKFFPATAPSAGSTTDAPPAVGNSSRLTLLVPTAALSQEDGERARVWVYRPDDTAELREITLGFLSRDAHREVLSGLHSGEKVILPPHDALSPGTRVTPNRK